MWSIGARWICPRRFSCTEAREPFGLVLAEAMARGTPVAAIDRGAVREVVEDGVTGVIFDDLDAMAGGLPRVLGLDRRSVRDGACAGSASTEWSMPTSPSMGGSRGCTGERAWRACAVVRTYNSRRFRPSR
jgi:glycosyltransferase involved in cell wall biosynthesis